MPIPLRSILAHTHSQLKAALTLLVRQSDLTGRDQKSMNGYEINIVLETENDARSVITKYESHKSVNGEYLEEIIPKLFDTSFSSSTKCFSLDSISRSANEIVLSCYGSKYPNVEIGELFLSVDISGQYAIKVKINYDGDGSAENFCIVNSEQCSLQKYLAFYRKNKIGYVSKSSKKKLPAKKSKPEKSESQIEKEALLKEKQDTLARALTDGTRNNEKTAIIRLLVRSKKKRELINNIFSPCLAEGNAIDYQQFCNRFDSSVNSEEYEVSWCYLKSITIKHHTWGQGPKDIIKYLSVIFEQGNYIYLGFRLDGIKDEEFDPSKYRVDLGVRQMTDLESLAVALSSIDGVSKASVKYRPTGKLGREYYVFYPDSGRSPHQVLGSVTEEYEWPMSW